MTLLLVVHVVAFVVTTVGPLEDTLPLHFVVEPITFVDAAIFPVINTVALNIVVIELPAIG
jgi:hypothetical protein